MKLGRGNALKSYCNYIWCIITTGYVVDVSAPWAVCDKCSRGWDVIVTNCFFVCICLFVCFYLFVCIACGHICVFCGCRHWCVTKAVTRTRRDWCSRNFLQSLMWPQLVTKFTSVQLSKNFLYQIMLLFFWSVFCQLVPSRGKSVAKKINRYNKKIQTAKGDVCNHASISIQILLCLARAVYGAVQWLKNEKQLLPVELCPRRSFHTKLIVPERGGGKK